ncbi:hypothetical protein ASG80_06055 [Agromyces sp. Soil535]|nr:hypothetical protein ASG80_06055 [Agromyces sp. Soil535]
MTMRFPGQDAQPSVADEPRRIRSLERARVGDSGYWTMWSSDYRVDYLWHSTSTITRIERLGIEDDESGQPVWR